MKVRDYKKIYSKASKADESDEETLNAVLADVDLLTDILLYHVAAEELRAAQVLERSSIGITSGSL